MTFPIEIINVKVENKGKYRAAIVNHKTADGKVDSKPIMSFTYKDVFATLSTAQQGDKFEVDSQKIKNEKDGKEYWTWVAVTPMGKSGEVTTNKVAQSVRSSYETPEERAARQVYIVRQSSISAAIALAEVNKAKGATVEEIIQVAKTFEDYVFNGVKQQVAEVV
jgi:hypothetical protein